MDEKKCKICGRKAVYIHFGALTCDACKVFFRRNAPNGLEKLKCSWDENCEINENNVHVCSYCRLKKCFTVGMQVELIRASLPKRKKTEKNPPTTTLPTTTLNLLQKDSSTLTTEQWNEISNLSNCFDEYSGFRAAEDYMKEQYLLPAKLRFRPQSFMKYYQDLFQKIELVYLNNKDIRSLSCDDRSLLLNNTLQHVVCFATNFMSNKTGLTSCPVYYDALVPVSHPKMIPITKLMEKQLDFDVTIMKIFLGIYCFSTINNAYYLNSPAVNLKNPKQVLDTQNKYIELAWKYLLYKIGFKETVKKFAYMLRYIFSVNETIFYAKSVQWFIQTMDSITEQTESVFITA